MPHGSILRISWVFVVAVACVIGLDSCGHGSSSTDSGGTTGTTAAATPNFAPAAGSYTGAQSVTISDVTPGATIYYTTDGTTPTAASSVYSGPVSVAMTETLKAVAAAPGYSDSNVGSASYTITLSAATPTFSLASGSYMGAQTVTLTDATSGATIYYTTDGTAPTTASSVYSGPITVNYTETISAIAAASGYANSAAGSASYTIIGGPPIVTLDPPVNGAFQLSGHAYNVDPTVDKVVIYALTNQWYVQPLIAAPYTSISANGTWTSTTNPWSSLAVLLVDPATYTPAPTEITNPVLDPGVLAWAVYPSGPVSVTFSGLTWGIKTTGSDPSDQFDPGPNFWSNSTSVVNVAADGLHLKIAQVNGVWQSGEVYLTKSLGYGTYTVQVSSRLDQLDMNAVAAPLFLYEGTNQEVDNEYSGSGGLIPNPNNAQFVVQPYTTPGNLVRYIQPATSQFTVQIEWRSNQITFTTWNGWASAPNTGDLIDQWTYQGSYNLQPGQERVHINLWLLGGNAPVSGVGNEMVINSFAFQP